MAFAATAVSANFTAKITINAKCVITTEPGDLNFGDAELLDAAEFATASFAFRCTKTTPYSIGITGTGGTGSVGEGTASITSNVVRSGGTEEIQYTATVVSPSGNATGAPQTKTINANMPAVVEAPVPGSYTDVLQVVVTY